MRIIKTIIRRKRVKLAAAAAVAVAAPAAALLSARYLPFAVDYMTEAAKYSDVSGLFSEKSDINNGAFILYSPHIDSSAAASAPIVTEYLPPVDNNETDAENIYLLSANISDKEEDLSEFSEHTGRIAEETFLPNMGSDFINLTKGGQLRNCTDISNEIISSETKVQSEIKAELYSDEPQVLIVHTHTSESYEPYEKDWYDGDYTSRSSDPDNSVVAVGEAIARELAAAGIAVIHDGTIHDEMYKGAYSRSLSTTIDTLSRYPSIKVVLDIHRDAIEYEDGTRVSAVTEIDGRKAAQVMIISAADEGSYDVPDFIDNLHFASELQQSMESRYPTLTRPILFQYCQYNQQVSKGALLIEVGSHGNSIDQAVYSGELIGKSLAALLSEKSEQGIEVSKNIPLYFIDRLM